MSWGAAERVRTVSVRVLSVAHPGEQTGRYAEKAYVDLRKVTGDDGWDGRRRR